MARTVGTKNNPPTKTEGFDVLALSVEASEVPRNHAGRELSDETKAAMDWLTDSHKNGDGTIGAPRKVVVPAGNSEYVLNLLRRAAVALSAGIDTEPVNLDKGRVEIRFRTRPKRERKAKTTDAAASPS